MPAPKLRPAFYLRCSSEESKKTGHTIKAQFESLKKFAESQESLFNFKPQNYKCSPGKSLTYVDEAVSGITEHRPELDRLYRDAQQKKFDIVLVWRIDRFYRKTLLLLQGIDKLTELNIKFKSLNEPFDTSTPYGKLALTMLGAVAQMEREVIMERTQAGRMMAARKGIWLGGGNIPFGYSAQEKKLVINPKEAKIVKFIFKTFVQKQLTATKLADRLNALKLLIPSAMREKAKLNAKSKSTSNFWRIRSLTRILSNPVYTDEYLHDHSPQSSQKNVSQESANLLAAGKSADLIRVTCPQIIHPTLFQQAQRQLKRNSVLAGRRVCKDEDAMLRGLIVCGLDNHRFLAKVDLRNPKKQRVYYYCGGSNKHMNPQVCPAPRLDALVIEPLVWEKVCNVLLQPQRILTELNELITKKGSFREVQTEYNTLIQEIKRQQAQRTRTCELYEDGLQDLPTTKIKTTKIDEKLEELNERKLYLTEKLGTIQNSQTKAKIIETYAQKIKAGLKKKDKASPKFRREVCKAIIEKVLVKWQNLDIQFRFNY